MNREYNKKVGLRLYSSRKALKMTRAELGKKIGLHESTIKRYEDGEIKSLDIDKIKEFAKALHVTPAYLMGWKEEEFGQTYFLDDEAKEIAQEIANNPDLHILFDTTRKVSKEDLQFVINLVKRLDKKDSGDY